MPTKVHIVRFIFQKRRKGAYNGDDVKMATEKLYVLRTDKSGVGKDREDDVVDGSYRLQQISTSEGFSTGKKTKYDVVGPVCESSDKFAHGIWLPETKRGDLVAIHTAGAYGQVMAMRYNQKDLAKAYYSDEIVK